MCNRSPNAGKRAAGAGRTTFGNLSEFRALEAAGAQAARCSQCGVPFCHAGLPTLEQYSRLAKLAAEGRPRRGLARSRLQQTNSPKSCGCICPQDRFAKASARSSSRSRYRDDRLQSKSISSPTPLGRGWVNGIFPPARSGPSLPDHRRRSWRLAAARAVLAARANSGDRLWERL